MSAEIERAINALAGKINANVEAGHALHYSQAMLNLAQTAAVLKETSLRPTT